MTNTNAPRELWIGLVEAAVREPRPADVDDDIAGAYLTFVCVCADAEEFESAAAEHVASEGWSLVRVEDVEPVTARLAEGKPARDVRKVIRLVERDGGGRSPDSWDLFPYGDRERWVMLLLGCGSRNSSPTAPTVAACPPPLLPATQAMTGRT